MARVTDDNIATATVAAAVTAYLECAFSTATDADGNELDLYDLYAYRWDGSTQIEAESIVTSFMVDTFEHWRDRWSPEQVGSDLWLSRNRNGGFNEHGTAGRVLSAAAETLGEAFVRFTIPSEVAVLSIVNQVGR